ncbi:MAG: ABC transporter ATP-binding protein [Ktedonobacteraceae bacterium]|nr:ABC transporter ATP-binding protein [Ktedonobacteraceae bacterium]MBO0790226.1 ABC transporter ATP-binding protein [Ktedonobacteraceae bacterium]
MKKTITLTATDSVVIEAANVQKAYHTGTVSVQALKGIHLHIQRGEVVAIMGPSGCGKTTLLNCLSGLDQVTKGSVKIAGQDISQLSDRALTAFRAREMGFIFQTYNLLPVLRAVENVELPLLVTGVRPRDARELALEGLARVGLEAWAHHRPSELSGGQQQRVAIARALATQPSIVWADEPTGALDSKTSQEIIDLMLQLNREHQQTFVWVTHAHEVAQQAQRLILMRDGLIVEDQPVAASAPPTSSSAAHEPAKSSEKGVK